MDTLNNEERALAWQSAWHPSFDGIAIVNPDFTFRSVNPQFCKLLGVTPADLIGQRFQDVTHPGIRKKDQENAQMVIDGLIDFYILPKKYLFPNGHSVEVILLVTRVPPARDGKLQFFISRIMLDEDGELMKFHQNKGEALEQSSPASMNRVAAFLEKHAIKLILLGAAIGGFAATILGINTENVLK